MTKIRTAQEYFERFSVSGCAERIETARLLLEWNTGPRWLDIGCGPVLPCWTPFAPEATHALGIDIHEEALALASRHQADEAIERPHEASLELARTLGLTVGDTQQEWCRQLYGKIDPYQCVDILRPDSPAQQLVSSWRGKWDLITQFGVFICLETEAEFISALRTTHELLNDNGRFIGAAWLASRWNGDGVWNGQLSALLTPQRISALLTECGFSLPVMRTIDLRDDATTSYDDFVVWVALKA